MVCVAKSSQTEESTIFSEINMKAHLPSRKATLFTILVVAILTYVGLTRQNQISFSRLHPSIKNKLGVYNLLIQNGDEDGTNTMMSSVTSPSNFTSFGVVNAMQNYSLSVENQMGEFETMNKNRSMTMFRRTDSRFIFRKWQIRSGKVQPDDLMKLGPFDFLPNYRNPCWKSTSVKSPPIECLPYYYLMGAPKSGTTDLHKRISRHPTVSLVSRKEPQWLPRSHYSTAPKLANYTKIFRIPTKDIFLHKNKSGWHGKIFGDSSASTLWDNDYWQLLPEFDTLDEPRYTNADYIHHVNPKAKLIAILRNPIDRLWSDYLYFHEVKSSKLFHDLVVGAIDYITRCLETRPVRFCVYHRPPVNITKLRLRIGLYSIHLKEFLRVFPRNQILVLKLEHHSEHMEESMKKVFDFLEIEPMDSVKMKPLEPEKHVNARKAEDKAIGEMLPKTRELLRKFYHPYNLELSELLGTHFNYNEQS